jgi:O-antigen/teichoic acid export membrane protein
MTSSRTSPVRIILRNVLSNWAGLFLSVLVGFFLAPFVVHRLGNTGYGIWTLVVSLTGYFGLLDLGIRSSVGRYVARYLARQEEEKVNRTVSTAFAILGLGGVVVLLAAPMVVHFLFQFFKIEPGYHSAAQIALLILAADIALALPLGVFTGILISLERYDVLNAVSIGGNLLRAALIVSALSLGYGLVALAVISLTISALESLARFYLAGSLFPALRVRPSLVSTENLKELLSFGIYRFVYIIAGQIIFYTDSTVIGVFLSAGAITFYAIAATLIDYSRKFVSSLTDSFYPLAVRLDAHDDLKGLRHLLVVGTKTALLFVLPIGIGFIFLGEQFITLWMGSEYRFSARILTVLTIPQLVGMAQYVSVLILAGMARHKKLAYLALGEALVNLVLSVILVRKLGLIGVAWGTAIPHLITNTVIIPLYALRQTQLPLGEYVRKALGPPALCALPFALICSQLGSRLAEPTWALFALEVVGASCVFYVLAFFLCLEPSQRKRLSEKLHGLVRGEALQQ